jgi:hypothetical protein
LLDANGDVPTKRYIMMDDVFIYHAHTLFLLSFVCVGTRTIKLLGPPGSRLDKSRPSSDISLTESSRALQ